MGDTFFQLLIPPLIVGGIAGMTLTVTGIDKVREIIVKKYNNRNHNNCQIQLIPTNPPICDSGIHENPIKSVLQGTVERNFDRLVHYVTLFIVLLFVVSEIGVFMSIYSIIQYLTDSATQIHTFTETSFNWIVFSYIIFMIAIIVTAATYIFMSISQKDFDRLQIVDSNYLDKIIHRSP
jgi:hypothetical protein